jgi:hypothetical protein
VPFLQISWAAMPAYLRASLKKFIESSPTTIVGALATANADAKFQLAPEAIDAWKNQLSPLVAAFASLIDAEPSSSNWEILLEYPIPIVGKRIDAVLLAHNAIVVIETKTGSAPTSASRQVDDYALNLACFHEGSYGKKIIPLVLSDAETARNSVTTDFDSLIEPCQISNSSNIARILRAIVSTYVNLSGPAIDPAAWDRGRFKPIPTIIDAAVALYSDMDVFEIGHACAAREDLEKTTSAIVEAILDSQRKTQKTICFVTGVPGAGKTLVGLNAVHHPEVKNVGSFLSGNGPLVKVIREALIRDVVARKKKTRAQAELEVQTFVFNVHRFADQYYQEGGPIPPQRVVVFDEAQRAWDADQNERAERPCVSEARMMLEVMDRHADWAVIVALVGGGQEINRGEAGLAEWGRALQGFPHWRVCASGQVLAGGDSTAGFKLFEDEDTCHGCVQEVSALHLDVCTRSIRAQGISDWVNAVLNGNFASARRYANGLDAKPLITRTLATTRKWLEQNRRGRTRAGLVCSSSAARLRADGIESSFDFHQRFEWERWFLDKSDCTDPDCAHRYCNDVRASSKLEVAATQFEVQGLELDWVGVCWGDDFTWNGGEWISRRFNNKVWRPLTDLTKQRYLLNAYRVLLTRARQGMIIYVPEPGREDRSRLRDDLDRTADFLLNCGAVLHSKMND